MSLLFPSYTSHPSLINIHISLSQFSLSFTLLLSPFYPSHPSVSNIYICFIFTKIPVTDIHKPVSQLSQIFILLLFPSHPYELSISNIHFLCLTHISANCEEYWYQLRHIHADLRWLWVLYLPYQITRLKFNISKTTTFFMKKNLTPKCWHLFAQYFFPIYFRNNLCVNPKPL